MSSWFKAWKCNGTHWFHDWDEGVYIRFGPGRWDDCYRYTCIRCGEIDEVNVPEGI